MADSKLSALSTAAAFSDSDLLYIVQAGVSVKTTWGAVKAAILLAKYPEVANYAALPAASGVSGQTYVCLAAQGTYFINRKPAGFYYSNGTTWSFVGELPENYFTDSILQISDDGDPTKVCKFQLSGISTGTTRLLTVQDKDGTIACLSDIATANPTASVGTAAVNGTAATLMRSDAAPAINQAMAPAWTGAHDFSAGQLLLPNGTAPTSEGQMRWDQNNDQLGVYDGQRERIISLIGWLPVAWAGDITGGSTVTTTAALAANGGAVAQMIRVTSPMRVVSCTFRNQDATLTRSMEFRLYKQRLNNGNSGENTLDEVAGINGTDTFTAAAASNRTVALGAITYLPAGIYWMVVRNTDPANAWTFGVANAGGTLSANYNQTKTLGSALGSTLDFVLATWTKATNQYGIRLNGAVFGQTSFFG